MMLVERRQFLPGENTGYYQVERRRHRRQKGTRINHDFALQSWQPEPDIKRVKFDYGMAALLIAEIAVIALVFASWVS